MIQKQLRIALDDLNKSLELNPKYPKSLRYLEERVPALEVFLHDLADQEGPEEWSFTPSEVMLLVGTKEDWNSNTRTTATVGINDV